MKILLLGAIAILASCNSSQQTVSEQPVNADAAVSVTSLAATITEAELKEHLYTYASDEFEGRKTGTEGQRKAVEYLREQYRALKVPAAKKDGDYFQSVPLEMTQLPTGTIEINGKTYRNGEDFLSFGEAGGSFDKITYAAFGIEESAYSDYKGLNTSGNVLMMKFGEPLNTDGTYAISGTSETSIWSSMADAIEKRTELALEKGAAGVLYYDPANYARYKNYYDYLKSSENGAMSIKASEGNPAFVVMSNAMTREIYPDIDKENVAKILNTGIKFNIESANKAIETQNVAAIIKGTEKPEEYIIISSHLDHIGVNADGKINNGADDDGSGTVAMLEIAQAFKKASEAGKGPKRSIIFLHVTGEENGLLGSQYYTDVEPIVPLAKTVANLNIDMIGRMDPKRSGGRNYIYLIGSDKLSTELHKLSEDVNKTYANLELDYTYNDENDPNRFYYRSDHYNFAKNNIPIIFYFNGTHEDYHRPGDTPDKINYDLLQNRTRLIFHTAWELANRDKRIVVDKMAK